MFLNLLPDEPGSQTSLCRSLECLRYLSDGPWGVLLKAEAKGTSKEIHGFLVQKSESFP